MTGGAEEYAWFAEDYALGLNFCLTFVRGVGPDEVLERLGGREPVEMVGVRPLEDGAGLVSWRPDTVGEDGVFYADRITGLAFLAVAAVGEWSMVVEPNGFLCTLEEVVPVLSRRGEMVSLYYSENNDPRFFWARDGVVLVDLDPTAAGWREGDLLDGELGRLGFDMSTEEIDPSDPRWHYDEQWQPRSLALMQHLTGVRLTAELLASAVFRCAAVPDPSGWAWVTADPGNIAPYTAEGLAADVRERLHAYAGAPDPDDAESTEDDDGWARRGVDDERLIASGWVGAELYGHDPSLVVALADADEDLRRRVIRWVRLWGFAEAELIDQPWFAAVRQAVESGGAVSDLDRERASQHFAPLLIAPEVGPDGRLDLGARHFHASGLIPVSPGDGSLAEAAEVLLAAAALDNLRFDRICGAVRRGFPELGGAHSE